MRDIEIPDREERLCIDCNDNTMQEPVSINLYKIGRGSCFGSGKDYKWNWECEECGTINQ